MPADGTLHRRQPCAGYYQSIGDIMISKSLSLLPLLALFALSACETVEGAGRDIQSAGTTVSEVAEDTQNEM